jgi:hypothetical protein
MLVQQLLLLVLAQLQLPLLLLSPVVIAWPLLLPLLVLLLELLLVLLNLLQFLLRQLLQLM